MEGVAAILVILFIALIIGGLIIYIMHLSAMSSALEVIPQPLRKMPPGNVWLTFIPLFGIVWQYIMVAAVSDSIKAEFIRRGMQRDEDRPGYNMGLTSCILWTCRIIPYIGLIPALIGIIMRLTHMNRIKAYTQFFEQNPFPWQQEHMAYAYGQPNYNAGQYANPQYNQQQQQYGYQQPYNPQQQYGQQQQPYNPQQQPYNPQQGYQQQPYNPQQGQQQNPNDPNKWMPPTPPPDNNNNPWAPKSDTPPPPPPAQ